MAHDMSEGGLKVDVPTYAQDLMAALGPQTETIEWVGFDGEHAAWAVAFDNQSAVLLDWFGEQESFILQAGLGAPPTDGQVAAYQAVLAYNALWRENGGARIAMVGASGELALMLELPARALTLDQLQRVLLGLKSAAERWRHCVAHPGQADVQAQALSTWSPLLSLA